MFISPLSRQHPNNTSFSFSCATTTPPTLTPSSLLPPTATLSSDTTLDQQPRHHPSTSPSCPSRAQPAALPANSMSPLLASAPPSQLPVDHHLLLYSDLRHCQLPSLLRCRLATTQTSSSGHQQQFDFNSPSELYPIANPT